MVDPLLFVEAACPCNCWRILQSATAKVLMCFQVMNPSERLRLLLSMFFLCIFLSSSVLFPPPLLYHFLLKQHASSLAWKVDLFGNSRGE